MNGEGSLWTGRRLGIQILRKWRGIRISSPLCFSGKVNLWYRDYPALELIRMPLPSLPSICINKVRHWSQHFSDSSRDPIWARSQIADHNSISQTPFPRTRATIVSGLLQRLLIPHRVSTIRLYQAEMSPEVTLHEQLTRGYPCSSMCGSAIRQEVC